MPTEEPGEVGPSSGYRPPKPSWPHLRSTGREDGPDTWLGGARPPRELAEPACSIIRWTRMPTGGHFAAMEEPRLLAEEIRAFFRPLWDAAR